MNDWLIINNMLSLSNSLRFMKTRGFNVVRFYECRTENELRSAFDKLNKPVVLKVDSEEYTHKTEVNGVVLNVDEKKKALKEFNRLMLLGESVVVQEQCEGTELIMGVNEDETFGKIIMFGLGGVLVELLNDVSFRACPINRRDAKEMIDELKASELIKGYRGRERVSKVKIKDLLIKLCKFAEENNVKSLDLNPVMFKGKNYHIVDARLEVN